MKSLLENYRTASVWLSLLILALAFVIGSDEGSRPVCVPLAFLAGTLLYGLGTVFHWRQGRLGGCLLPAVLTGYMAAGVCLSLLYYGGAI